MIPVIILLAIIAVCILALYPLVMVRCPPNSLLIISGVKTRIVTAGRIFQWPMLEQVDVMGIAPMTLTLQHEGRTVLASIEFDKGYSVAVTRLFGLPEACIIELANRIILNQLSLLEKNGDLEQVREMAGESLNKIGLTCSHLTITQ